MARSASGSLFPKASISIKRAHKLYNSHELSANKPHPPLLKTALVWIALLVESNQTLINSLWNLSTRPS